MPHFTVEYSSNVEEQVEMTAFCDAIRRAALATEVFETGAVRVRTVRCDHYSIADDDSANGFIDVSLRIGAGRDLATRKRIGEAIFATMTGFLQPLFGGRHFALSFEIREIDPELSWKKNSIHERLRK